MLMTPNLFKRCLLIRSPFLSPSPVCFTKRRSERNGVSSESISDGIVKGDGDEVNWIFLENKPDNFFECSVRKSTNTTTI